MVIFTTMRLSVGKFPVMGVSVMFMRSIFLLFFCINQNILAEKTTSPILGQQASKSLIIKWNRDIFPDGEGLPKGKGTASFGKKVYQQHCESCHGFEGTGNSADELAGAQHSLTDTPPDKVIGTYWPYATTLFDFTRRSMPLNAPGSLTTNELYAVTAYLLYLNHVIKKDKVISNITLPEIKMPNRKGFINAYFIEKDQLFRQVRDEVVLMSLSYLIIYKLPLFQRIFF
jgi:cytochrome c